MSGAVAIIPARMESTRFPGKPLAPLRGAPMLRHVYEAARRARSLERVVIATDSEAIERAARDFGAETVRTASTHATGSDRAAEAARLIGGAPDVIVNVQGDEPLLSPHAVDEAVAALRGDPEAGAATLAHWEEDPEALARMQCVFVDVDARGYATDFWRGSPSRQSKRARRHVGVYAYRPRTLATFAMCPPTEAEQALGLEQLRLLEAGINIRVVVTAFRSRGVDTPEDLAALERDWLTLAATAGGTATGSGDASA